jgi:hypothetical protein
MDSRWQPCLGPVQPATTVPEACDLLADGWRAEPEDCWIAAPGRGRRMVSPETWRALRDRGGFARPRIEIQRS